MCGIEDTPALFQSASHSTFYTQGLRPWAGLLLPFRQRDHIGYRGLKARYDFSPGSKTLGMPTPNTR